MATQYPDGLDAIPDPPAEMDDTPTHESLHEDTRDAVQAVQAELGTNPAGGFGTVRDRLDAVGASRAMVVFTSDGVFTKGAYPWAQWVRVRVVGGGGGSGGTDTTSATERAESAGGGGGGYSEKLIAVGDLGASETVTVGAGGSAGNSGSAPAGGGVGGTGGTSSFGSHCSATGGGGGNWGPGAGSGAFGGAGRGYRGVGSGGDINLPGGHGGNGVIWDTQPSMQNWGGHGGGGLGAQALSSSGYTAAAITGENYGGGASGARATVSNPTGAVGAAGAPGVVIVEVF